MLGPFPLAGLMNWGVALSPLGPLCDKWEWGVGATSVGKADGVYSCVGLRVVYEYVFH